MKINDSSRGFSLYFSWGNNTEFDLIEKDGPSFRIKLWKLSICFALADIEGIIQYLLDELKDKDIFINKRHVVEDSEMKLQIRTQELEIKEINFKKKIDRAESLEKENSELRKSYVNIKDKYDILIKKLEECEEDRDDTHLELQEAHEETIKLKKCNKEAEEKLKKDMKDAISDIISSNHNLTMSGNFIELERLHVRIKELEDKILSQL